ncbi:MAG: cobalt-precorrin-5B (C(1))-methyltransferase CbiD [Clostridiales bacterium]|nr:cobalt-precorrin-5B (C(1))-methyltransferase CbiD [Clostridiales bacterium]
MTPLREGFTTGSCAAACALASCLWQRDGECPEKVEIVVPEGRTYAPVIHPLCPYRCAVYKDSGDDPDITNGSEVWAEVFVSSEKGDVSFTAGEGVGTITLPGLKLPVGEAAINPVPRQMIAEAVKSVFPDNAANVTVGIAGGRETAKKTFNPRLGIEGGLSILGTTGVVRPMSEDALTDTIRLEMDMRRQNGAGVLGLVFGSQGETALSSLRPNLFCVQISNFVGFALDTAAELGFEKVVLAGQPGKLAKVAGGCMQTHSKYGDGRREAVTAHLALMGAPKALTEAVMASVTLDGVIPLIRDAGYGGVWTKLCEAAASYCLARVKGALKVETVMLDGQGNLLGTFGE